MGEAPTVMCRSEALRLTTSIRMSAKSNLMPCPPSASVRQGSMGSSPGARHAGDLGDAGQAAADLVEADAALVAGAAAAGAADRLEALEVQADVEAVGPHDLRGHHHAALALVAEQPGEALGDDAIHRRAHQERLDPHLDETGHGARGVV